jgi:hypothetical protein
MSATTKVALGSVFSKARQRSSGDQMVAAMDGVGVDGGRHVDRGA